MRRGLFGILAIAALGLMLGQGDAGAQAQPGEAAPAAIPSPVAPSKLTPAQQLAEADAALSQMASARTAVRRQLETARSQRDVVKTLCLNDKLNQMDVAIRSAGERRAALEAAASRNEADLANHEFTILAVLRQRADQLTAEANQCIGGGESYIGDTAVTSTVEIDYLDDEDPSQYPTFDVIVELPTCSSCIK